MKTLGIIGGIGPESTIEYYRLLVATWRAQQPDGSYPSLLINSIDVQRMLALIGAQRLAEVTAWLLAEIEKLARAGADFALLSANTPHVIFDELQQSSPLPLLSIVEATCAAAQAQGLRNVGLFGTRFTMRGSFYPAVLARAGIALSLPDADEQAYIHEKYLGELVNGVFLPATRERLLRIAARMKEQDGIQGLILGGTELPLLLREQDSAGMPLLDTTRIHVECAVACMLPLRHADEPMNQGV